ncbi:MAG: Sensor histidine kinase [Myxococcaceae bacterium]|nr:Sensor histidine kinase [Myxococcaceae bacterium]
MAPSRLADFIDRERGAIVAEWEAFAGTLLPAARGMNARALRDHADEILSAIVSDMRSHQSVEQQAEKSKGRGEAQRLEMIGQVHAALRIENGFKLSQLVAEYRALRASVMRLWEKNGSDSAGVTRFNEAIDEALVEAVDLFTRTSEHYRDQTLGILGHDLRNPLAAIITGSTMLIGTDDLDDRTVRIAARMLNSANRMNRMIGDLLDLTRTRSGDLIPVTPASIDLETLCREVVAELEGLHPTEGLRFHASGDLRGEWDADRIAQVVSNLIRNAVQHGGAAAPVDLTIGDHGEEVWLEVHNHGPAISETAQRNMFEPMVRHVAPDRKNSGLGLGLYIAAQIVLAHHGSLTVSSTEADGTTFTARLPRKPPAAARPSTPPGASGSAMEPVT